MTPEERSRDRRAYLEALFEPHEIIDLRFIAEGEPVLRLAAAGIDGALSIISEHGRGRNCYAGVASRRTLDGGGGKDNVHAARALWVDKDYGDDPDGEREDFEALLEQFPHPPSMRVWSGGGDHLYWLLDEPWDLTEEESRYRFECTLAGLADYFAADGNVAECARVMRIPGTMNYPDARKTAKGQAADWSRVL